MQVRLPIDGSTERYPKGNLIQGWKENVALYQQSLHMAGHNGWDLVKGYDEPVYAPHDGTVCLVDFQGQGYGNRVDIIGEEENGRFLVTTLGHLTEEKMVTVGQKVKMGDQVAKMGNSGFVVSAGVSYWGQANPDKKGTHTHWTVKWLHKFKPGEQGASVTYMGIPYIIENYNNGVFGSFDNATLFGKESMRLVKNTIDGKTIGIYTGHADHRILAFAEVEALGLLGDEPQEPMDFTGIPIFNIVKNDPDHPGQFLIVKK